MSNPQLTVTSTGAIARTIIGILVSAFVAPLTVMAQEAGPQPWE